MTIKERYIPESGFMHMAISEALGARAEGEYAVGSALVMKDRLIAASGNRTKRDNLATAHAEMLVIARASRILGQRRLTNCIMYTTHEPCPMCAGAIVMAQIPLVVVGAKLEDMQEFANKNGNETWKWRTIDIPATYIFARSDPSPKIIPDFMREECIKLFHS